MKRSVLGLAVIMGMSATASWAVFLPVRLPPETQQELQFAKQMFENSEFKEAAVLLLQLMERAEADWMMEIPEEQRFIGVRAYGMDRWHNLPRAVRTAAGERFATSHPALRQAKEAEDGDALWRMVNAGGMAGGGSGQLVAGWMVLDTGEMSRASGLLARPTLWEDARIMTIKARWEALVKAPTPAHTVAPMVEREWSPLPLWNFAVEKKKKRQPNDISSDVVAKAWCWGDKVVVRHPSGTFEVVVNGESTLQEKVKRGQAQGIQGQQVDTSIYSLPALSPSGDQLWMFRPKKAMGAGMQGPWARGKTEKLSATIRSAEWKEDKKVNNVKVSFQPLEFIAGENRLYLIGADPQSRSVIGYAMVDLIDATSDEPSATVWEGTLGRLDDEKGLPGEAQGRPFPTIETIANGTTAVITIDQHAVVVVDQLSGHVRWGRSLVSGKTKAKKRTLKIGDPAITALGRDTVFSMSPKGTVIAWDRETGRVKWEVAIEGDDPQLVGATQGVVMVATSDQVSALAEDTGNARWTWKPQEVGTRSGSGCAYQFSAWVPFGTKLYQLHAGTGQMVASLDRPDAEPCALTASDRSVLALSSSTLLYYGHKP